MALWRSWLARRPVTAEVAGSSPVRVVKKKSPSSDGFLLLTKAKPRLGSVAQLVERSTENRKVTGSMPVGATEPPCSFYIKGVLSSCPIRRGDNYSVSTS